MESLLSLHVIFLLPLRIFTFATRNLCFATWNLYFYHLESFFCHLESLLLPLGIFTFAAWNLYFCHSELFLFGNILKNISLYVFTSSSAAMTQADAEAWGFWILVDDVFNCYVDNWYGDDVFDWKEQVKHDSDKNLGIGLPPQTRWTKAPSKIGETGRRERDLGRFWFSKTASQTVLDQYGTDISGWGEV